MIKIVILAGGDSLEREVSLRSGAAVSKALKVTGYETEMVDPAGGLSEQKTVLMASDVVFPALHGAGGEDGEIQKVLESWGVPFVGSNSSSSRLCFDKWEYRQAVTAANLPVANGALVDASSYQQNGLSRRPFVLKPLNGGSSIDTYIVRDPGKIPQVDIAKTFGCYGTMLIEELVEGAELTVGILGNEALPIIEIIPPENGEFDYENKYNGASQENVAPDNISPKIQKAAQGLALKAHKLTGCRDFSRSDIMCDKSGKLFLLETNTIPGMTDQSLFPKMAAAAGLPMPALCNQLIEMALSR